VPNYTLLAGLLGAVVALAVVGAVLLTFVHLKRVSLSKHYSPPVVRFIEREIYG
jgi:hypothetical protein